MINNSDIIIVTPTYNRRHTLDKLYQSLIRQRDQNFLWLIIDDGSSDDTKAYIEELLKENKIKIMYKYIDNGGKAKALNTAFSLVESEALLVVVDSDDYLLDDAVEIFSKYNDKYKNNKEVGALFFHYQSNDGKILKPSGDVIDSDQVMTRYTYNNKFIQNDGCVAYFTRSVEKYKYPQYTNEKYVGPTVIQFEMANDYKIVFSTDVVGVAEYQADGLTNLGRKLRLENPLGMLHYSGLQMSGENNLKTRIKYAISAQAYRFISKLSKEDLSKLNLKKYLKPWAALPGYLLKTIWLHKYKD